jgi:ubiquinone/menaquinone biosynthesis C-methylase UbiE
MSDDGTQISNQFQIRDRQYANSEKLSARARLHRNYTIAEEGWFSWVAKRFAIAPRARVLDVGCGPAWFWAAVADVLPEQIELTLADISPGMVSEAMGRAGSLRSWTVAGRTADGQALPFASETFDTVIAMHMLYHVPEPEKAIAEMHRVLRPGGTLAVTTNGIDNMRALYALTTTFGSAPTDPAAAAFGFDDAARLIESRFGNVRHEVHPARMRITEPEDVFLALTSYPPGDGASEDQLTSFRRAIEDAFAAGDGALDVQNQMGVFIGRKA